jgi:hypothetical protein
MKLLAFVVVLSCVFNVWSSLIPKQLAGPASEFDAHRLPKPFAGALVEGSAMFRANFAKIAKQNPPSADSNVVWQQKLLVDSDTKFMFSFFSPCSEKLKLDLVDANGQKVRLHRFALKVDRYRIYVILSVCLCSEIHAYSCISSRITSLLVLTLSPAPHTYLRNPLSGNGLLQ